MLESNSERQIIIDQIIAAAKTDFTQMGRLKGEITQLEQFIQRCYVYAPLSDLKQRSARDLCGVALTLWDLMQQREAGEYKRCIFNPQVSVNGWETSHTALAFVLDDQPFLVDTICTEINRKGMTVEFLIHPGCTKVLRDSNHQLKTIFPPDAEQPNIIHEAPIYLEIDRQTDPSILEQLAKDLDRVIHDARIAVADWKSMCANVQQALTDMEMIKPPAPNQEIEESKAFLRWMLDNHFTFLGYRSYDFIIHEDKPALRLDKNSALGVLRDTSTSRSVRYYEDLTPQARDLGLSNQIILLAKTNTRSTVHGRRYTDFVSVKRFDLQGNIIGERWFVGLFTSIVYNDNPNTFPLVRLKIAQVLERSGLPRYGHAYKALVHILENLPRDDLFHATLQELYALGLGVLELQDKRCVRLFARKDIYGRFMSCLVYLPRDDFNIELCTRIEEILLSAFHGLEISYETLFPDSVLARIHFTIRTNPRESSPYDLNAIEQKLIIAATSWREGLQKALANYFGEERGNGLNLCYSRAFPSNYQETFTPQDAVLDIAHVEQLSNAMEDLQLSLYNPDGVSHSELRLKLFHSQTTVPLSDAIPILEKMGLRVIGEEPYKIQPKGIWQTYINDFSLVFYCGSLAVTENRSIFEEAFKKIWQGQAEHDGFNILVLSAQLSWREVTILRAYAKYLKQIGTPFSQDYFEQTFAHNPSIARLLVHLFLQRFDPKLQQKNATTQLECEIHTALDQVVNLDEDRILRLFLNLIQSTVRTNYFQVTNQNTPKSYLSFKFNPACIDHLPLPRPQHEIFVYSPRFEGVHLRAGKVARGGIRWSDRREDFRREILGLMKAQQVKNAVIVPAGAKGGFVTKAIATDAKREDIQKEGIECYQNFMRGLLDLTDNLVKERVLPPENTVCLDDEDFYLVVAADKGTAAFSDIANAIAKEYYFWLGDAFASGGSTGYDHKKIAITARGAFESVKQHFAELSLSLEQPFTVMGVGDMSGDVFGNGLLLSDQIKLIAAFNGAHIFIDPNPDPAVSFAERLRLFQLPRSGWDDYNSELISQGGGVFSRTLKSIKLTPQIQQVLAVSQDQLTPNECIQAILMAPLDLFWNGGIGTFVKASSESAADVGDRGNDAIRINGCDLRCKVIAEGGNLGFTQLGRIEYELQGGKINTDFIDNSGGVDCSDHEVNSKILLNSVVVANELGEAQRNVLLADMTDAVAHLVLHNNYRQVRAISLGVAQASKYTDLYLRYIQHYTQQGKINPELEFLPNQATIQNRQAIGKSFTRPEIAVLLAYSKIILKEEILHSDVVHDPDMDGFVKEAFPEALRQKYFAFMQQHQLKPEILATQISNDLITNMGITFVYQMQDELRVNAVDVVRGYVVAAELFEFSKTYAKIEKLAITPDIKFELCGELVQVVRRATRWFLRNQNSPLSISQTIARFSLGIRLLENALPELLVEEENSALETRRAAWINAGVPTDMAMQIVRFPYLISALNIILTANFDQNRLLEVAKIYFTLTHRLALSDLWKLLHTHRVEGDYWKVLARSAIKADLDRQQRALTRSILQEESVSLDAIASVERWIVQNQRSVNRWLDLLAAMKVGTLEYAMLVVVMRELGELAQ